MIINSLDQLNKVSKKIIGKISNEDCILLYGELGAGKTTLTRSIINSIQNKYKTIETEVLSPTFNIVYEYEIKSKKIMHYDLYRLKTEKEAVQLGIFDQDFKCIKIIEWAEIIKKKPTDRLDIYISYHNKKNSRKFNFKGYGSWKDFNGI